MLQQHHYSKAKKLFGEEAKNATFKELEQMHLRDSFIPKSSKELTQKQRDEALESITMVKEKKSGEIKARTVADGRKQRGTMSKESVASPTAAIESVLITAVQEAKEHRDVVTMDIPNAFIQTKAQNDDDKIILILRGEMAEIMAMVAPEIYSPYVEIKKGKKVLYVECQTVIYG